MWNKISFFFSSCSISIITGNVLDHYDTNLYSFLAPVLAPLFFPNHDPIVALILSYGIMSIGALTKPLGIFYFSKLAWNSGARKALSISLFGLAICTAALGMLPVYEQVGFLAPFGLGLIRASQGFFAGGEHAITGLYLVESAKKEQQNVVSAIYQSSTVLGILLASLMGWLCVSFFPEIWRLGFLLGSLTGLVGCYLRRTAIPFKLPIPNYLQGGLETAQLVPEKMGQLEETPDAHGAGGEGWAHGAGGEGILLPEKIHVLENITFKKMTQNLSKKPKLLFSIASVSALSYVTYAIPFVFLNSFAGLASNISYETMLRWNTIFLVFDMVACPFFSWCIGDKIRGNFMANVALIIGISVAPLFYFLPHGSLQVFLFVRIWIVVLGLTFLAPMYAWFYEVTEEKERYLFKGIGYMIGSEALGRPATAICLWLWYKTESVFAPACYIIFVCGLAFIGIRSVSKNEKKMLSHSFRDLEKGLYAKLKN